MKENKTLYHGSIIPDIGILNPVSRLHNTESKVVYLTDNVPYALFYIWDSAHNVKSGKHITAWMRDGMAYYEEQFPNQMKAFYDGVRGYLYSVEQMPNMMPVADREAMFSCHTEVVVNQVKAIDNVYESLVQYETDGKLKIIRFEDVPKERITALYEHMADNLTAHGVTEKPNCEEALFYQKYFSRVWDMAVKPR